MKQIIVKSGKTLLEEVPKPVTPPGTVLVKVAYSCISQGTEISGIKSSGKGKLQKITDFVKSKPDAIKKAIEFYKQKGLTKLVAKLDFGIKPIGYSVSGTVEAVGEGVADIEIDEKVACAGAGIANHAEYVVVPRNLVMKVPDNLNLNLASTVTLGGIAMQGVRRGDFKLGEYVAVIGLGFLGLLTVEMLKASGCRVVAMDLDDKRCELAKKHGAEKVYNTTGFEKIENEVIKWSNGYGVDGVIFTAATDNPSVISSAFKMCKRKGKVVLVGVAGNKIDRQDMYGKELNFLISTSYGPGRYDNDYELKGIDYPYAYVRWTENRNMEEYLRLLADKRVVIDDLIEKTYPIQDAEKAYQELQTLKDKPVIALFEYPETENKSETSIQATPTVKKHRKTGVINVAVIGAGGFAKGTHLPNLQKLADKYKIYAICDINALNAQQTAKQFGAEIATTDYSSILQDEQVDLVMICTRHNLHAPYAMMALKAGKAVFVEKPMAINQKELDELTAVIKETGLPFMVGFNRRFSPFAKEIKQHIKDRTNPMIISYRMNAGYAPPDAWIHSDGGRIIGEGCHIIDLFSYFTGANIETISVEKITPRTKAVLPSDNVCINLKYDDGSVANLIYTGLGSSKYPKEHLELYCDNKIFKMTDYLELDVFGDKYEKKTLKQPDKGHLQELVELHRYLIGSIEGAPIKVETLIETTKTTFLL